MQLGPCAGGEQFQQLYIFAWHLPNFAMSGVVVGRSVDDADLVGAFSADVADRFHVANCEPAFRRWLEVAGTQSMHGSDYLIGASASEVFERGHG